MWAELISLSDDPRASNKLAYKIVSDDEVELYSCWLSEYSIPSTITYEGKTYKVIGIGYEAVSSDITSISIPNSVKYITGAAFASCKNLTSIEIPNSVTTIGPRAFENCGFSSITIPEGVIRISQGVFTGCSKLTSVIIPNSVTTIEDEAFSGCSALKSITIPSSVTNISEEAFAGCTGLVKVSCLSKTPPEAYANSFENYNGYLYIPCDNKEDYELNACFGTFKHIECLGSESVELTKDEVKVEPERSEAVFTMPSSLSP